ncbi:MAG TPA: type II toxin-antitoxin system RelE/ParE family toxin [Paraburkholderia sp.]|uniref:type II toxin-antitoxin system RelE/ParE family toxin n=1 Tax=Paraburkholderia sp. TaxID=1926495 RepID=UPI002B47B2A1|nr:type II toxin-antitoxin system RelE/ParE family toxin [Paraburkholderia sp.]HKR43456.1 type II toxin-antitoxin system RelE/ParE family toxin [Paraburkholderia sp.]
MKAVFLQSARTDLQDIRRYVIAKFGPKAWRETSGKIRGDIEQLEAFPRNGSIPPELVELGFANYRQIVSGMNRIIYEIDDPMIYIHLIVDTRRDLKDVLARILLRP